MARACTAANSAAAVGACNVERPMPPAAYDVEQTQARNMAGWARQPCGSRLAGLRHEQRRHAGVAPTTPLLRLRLWHKIGQPSLARAIGMMVGGPGESGAKTSTSPSVASALAPAGCPGAETISMVCRAKQGKALRIDDIEHTLTVDPPPPPQVCSAVTRYRVAGSSGFGGGTQAPPRPAHEHARRAVLV